MSRRARRGSNLRRQSATRHLRVLVTWTRPATSTHLHLVMRLTALDRRLGLCFRLCFCSGLCGRCRERESTAPEHEFGSGLLPLSRRCRTDPKNAGPNVVVISSSSCCSHLLCSASRSPSSRTKVMSTTPSPRPSRRPSFSRGSPSMASKRTWCARTRTTLRALT